LEQPVKYFRTVLNGYDKKDVTEYIAKIHTIHRQENDKHRQLITALQIEKSKLQHENEQLRQHAGGHGFYDSFEVERLQQECDYLRQQLAYYQNSAGGIREIEKIVEVPVEHIVEKIIEVPVERIVEVEKLVEVPRVVEKFVPYAAEPDEEMLEHLRKQAQVIERLNMQIDAHIGVRGQLEVRIQELEAALNMTNANRKQYNDSISVPKAMQHNTSRGIDAESLAYHRAEMIEQEAQANANKIRAGLQALMQEVQEVLRGVQAQTAHETAKINTQANNFLQVLGNMPDMLDDVLKQATN